MPFTAETRRKPGASQRPREQIKLSKIFLLTGISRKQPYTFVKPCHEPHAALAHSDGLQPRV